MAKVTRNFLFAGFLILGLIPTIICILFPPTLGLIEKPVENGINVTLNNWFNTREHPSIEMPQNVITSIKNDTKNLKQLFDNQFSINLQPQKKILNIELKQNNKKLAAASFYHLNGTHAHTTLFSNSNFNILLENIAANDYYMLLNFEGNTYSKMITITK